MTQSTMNIRVSMNRKIMLVTGVLFVFHCVKEFRTLKSIWAKNEIVFTSNDNGKQQSPQLAIFYNAYIPPTGDASHAYLAIKDQIIQVANITQKLMTNGVHRQQQKTWTFHYMTIDKLNILHREDLCRFRSESFAMQSFGTLQRRF